MGKVVRYRPRHAQTEWTASIGMILFLGSWAMMFGSLFFAYGIIRAHSVVWPPPDLPHLPRVLPAVNTVALATSSAFLQRGLAHIGRDAVQKGARFIGACAVLGLVGLIALVWLFWKTSGGRFNAARHLPVRLWTMYWHFVGAVWGLMFVLIYVF